LVIAAEVAKIRAQKHVAALPRELDRLGCSRAVIVCAAWVHDCPHVLAALQAALGARLAGCFDGVQEHSPVPAVEEARRSLERAGADAVIAVGGGSAIVTARAASILLAEKRDVRELCTRRAADGRLTSPRLLAPKIPNWVVPTTPISAYAKAGSAVRDPETGERLALFDPKTRAQGIFLDPDMALTAPAGLAGSAALNASTCSAGCCRLRWACPDGQRTWPEARHRRCSRGWRGATGALRCRRHHGRSAVNSPTPVRESAPAARADDRRTNAVHDLRVGGKPAKPQVR